MWLEWWKHWSICELSLSQSLPFPAVSHTSVIDYTVTREMKSKVCFILSYIMWLCVVEWLVCRIGKPENPTKSCCSSQLFNEIAEDHPHRTWIQEEALKRTPNLSTREQHGPSKRTIVRHTCHYEGVGADLLAPPIGAYWHHDLHMKKRERKMLINLVSFNYEWLQSAGGAYSYCPEVSIPCHTGLFILKRPAMFIISLLSSFNR